MNVSTYSQLQAALLKGEKEITLTQAIAAPAGLSLAKGQALVGADPNVFISFINGDGIALKGDNRIESLMIQTGGDKRAIYIDSQEKDLGTISLRHLTVTGNVQLLTRPDNHSLNLEIEDIDIVAADARPFSERPMKYGVIVYQGALTIYNFNPDPESLIKANISGLSLGRPGAPVIGSGLFVSGFGDEGGQVHVDYLATDAIYSNGMIPSGQPNLITGGIFVVYGALVDRLESRGPVTTYGTNDMVLDVWGRVKDWSAQGPITSYGASGIGFVNFGSVDSFVASAPITTYGLGARGFNQYDGTITKAEFDSITTYGDGSIGMQFSKPVGDITINGNLTTNGSVGATLVKGVIKNLQADAISVLEGGKIDHLTVKGDIVVKGDHVVGYHINGGQVDHFDLGGQIVVDSPLSRDREIA